MLDKPYSNWIKIDLHIHTDKSKETKLGDYKGNFSVDVLCDKLVQNGVGLFSLTDHNIINVDAYREYYEKYAYANYPKLLLGIELDIVKENSDKDDTNFHTLLIFNIDNH